MKASLEPLRFCAHLGYLFREHALPARVALARACGFVAIEHPAPYDIPAAQMRALLQEANLQFVQLALPAGDPAKGEKGFAASPGREGEFRESLEIALAYAQTCGARHVQVQSGTTPRGWGEDELWETYLGNLTLACERAAAAGMGVLIEPIGPATLENYFMCRTALAVRAIRTLGRPNLRMLYDTFHGRGAGEDPAAVIREHAGIIGHIQIADFPGRHEPGTGTTDFPALFATLIELSWPGFVGCEYQPSMATEASLGWLG